MKPLLLLAPLLPALALLQACESAASPDDFRGVRRAESNLAQPRADQPASLPPLMVNGQALAWEELIPALSEAAGRQVLEEHILDRVLDDRLTSERITLGPDAIETERRLLAQTASRGSGLASADLTSAIERERRDRGLGPVRFAALLARTAKLRALVSREISVSPQEVQRAQEIRFGEKAAARIIVTRTQQEAAAIRRRLLEGAHAAGPANTIDLPARFAAEAAENSIDPSSARGGVLGSAGLVSPADAAFPSVLRSALRDQPPGEIGPIIVLPESFALLLVERREPAQEITRTPEESAKLEEEIRADVRLAKERLAMDRTARELLESARLTIFDEGLRWSWETRSSAAR